MEMVQQRKQGLGGQGPSTSGGFTWADPGAMRRASHNGRVSAVLLVCRGG